MPTKAGTTLKIVFLTQIHEYNMAVVRKTITRVALRSMV